MVRSVVGLGPVWTNYQSPIPAQPSQLTTLKLKIANTQSNKGGGEGGGFGIPKLYVKFWWPLFLALKTTLFWPRDIWISGTTHKAFNGLNFGC